MKNMKTAAVVAAFNEQENIGNVLRVLLSSKDLDEVIVVDDGSKDRTSQIAESMGAKTLRITPNKGKGNAMREGVKAAGAEVILFVDADLVGFSGDHISLLLKPVLEREVDMSVGLRDRLGGMPKLITKIDPLFAIGGERAMRRNVFEAIPERFIQGFAVETALNYYCLKNRLKVEYVDLKGLGVVIKEKKWGFWKGFKNRVKMFWQMLKIRLLIISHKKEF